MNVSGGIVVSANGTITMVGQETGFESEGGHGSFTDGRDRNSLDDKLAVPMLKTGYLNKKDEIGHGEITFGGKSQKLMNGLINELLNE